MTLQEKQLKEMLSNALDTVIVTDPHHKHTASLKSARDKLALITHARPPKVVLTPIVTSFDDDD